MHLVGFPLSFFCFLLIFSSLCLVVALFDVFDDKKVYDIGCENASYFVSNLPISLADIDKLLRGKSSPSLSFNVSPFDPRMLFAIRPAYWSVQYPHQAPSFDQLDDCLAFAAENFVIQTLKYDKNAKQVFVPQVIEWFQSDFGNSDKQILEKLASYVKNESWNKTWKSILNSSPKIVYQQYKRLCFRCLPY